MAIVVLVLWLFTVGAGFYLLVTSNLGRARPAATTLAVTNPVAEPASAEPALAEPALAESATVPAAATAASATSVAQAAAATPATAAPPTHRAATSPGHGQSSLVRTPRGL